MYLEGPLPLPRTCPVRNQPLGRGFLWPDVKVAKLLIFAPSIWTLEIDGKPTLAFEAMKYREADEICHQEWMRLELGQRKINYVPLCGANSHLRIRLARPAEMDLYRQAAETNKLSDDGLVTRFSQIEG